MQAIASCHALQPVQEFVDAHERPSVRASSATTARSSASDKGIANGPSRHSSIRASRRRDPRRARCASRSRCAPDLGQRGRAARADSTVSSARVRTWVPIRRYSRQTLRVIGWPLYRVASVVQWCGHQQEFIPVPDEGEWARMVPVIGTAK